MWHEGVLNQKCKYRYMNDEGGGRWHENVLNQKCKYSHKYHAGGGR